jgi:hypothetical protein
LTRKSCRKKQTSPYEEEEVEDDEEEVEEAVPEQQSSSNTKEKEGQPSGSNKEKKETRSIFAKLKPRFGKKKIEPARQSNFDEVMVETMKETIICEEGESYTEQPTSSKIEVKGSPADLAKLMTKLHKTAKNIEKLRQELSKTMEEELQTRMAINALAAKFHDILDESVASSVKQINDDPSTDVSSGIVSSFDDQSSDDESEIDVELLLRL